ncbi:phosphatidate cytidylyltransferase [bacterium]|nr:phosphatidate cytidylyltransferase [bacterium]
MKKRLDLREFEREIQAAAEKARVDAQEIVDRLRSEAQTTAERVRADASAATGRMKAEAVAAGGRVKAEAKAAGGRVKHEAQRKAIHLFAITIPLGLLYLPITPARRVLMGIAVALLLVDLAKIHQPRLRSYFTQFFGHLIRRHEHSEVTASTYLVVSALVVSYLFEAEVAAASLVFLIIGDTLAAMVGKAWGRTRLFGKTLEGFLAGWISSFLVAWALVPSFGPWPLLAASFVGAVVEILPIPVDDNFRIPLLTALVLRWIQ